MQINVANELNLGRDLYPTDSSWAAAQASRWMIADRGGTQDVQTSFMGLKKTDMKAKNKDGKNNDNDKKAPEHQNKRVEETKQRKEMHLL